MYFELPEKKFEMSEYQLEKHEYEIAIYENNLKRMKLKWKWCYNTKRKMLSQRGGFLLPLLLPPLLSAGVGAITSALNK